jgi:hypothetical protein
MIAALALRKVATIEPKQIVEAPKLSLSRLAFWAIIAAIPSGLILSTTLHLTTDIIAMPLIWMVPLGLYLLSFSLAFSNRSWMTDRLTPFAPWLILGLSALALSTDQFEIYVTGGASLALLFVVSLVLHRKLYVDRPEPAALTQFYLALAFGGAIGGAFVTIAAPLLLDWTYEFPLLAIAAAWLVRRKHLIILICAVASFVGLFAADPLTMSWNGLRHRSYFGIYTIRENETGTKRTLAHGNTIHGAQHLETDKLIDPTTYYGRQSGAGQILSSVDSNARIGVLGMGVGTLACYAQPHQQWAFYEIDPLVVDIATKQGWFTFMANCTPNAAVHIGDARQTLAKQPSGSLDILVMDVFSSDTIPTHLLTREAFDIYDSVLAERGVMLMHISNRYLDLEPVIASEAQARGWAASLNRHDPTEAEFTAGETASVWVLIARSKDELTHMLSPKTQSEWRPLTLKPNMVRWTDDHSSILSLLKPIFN